MPVIKDQHLSENTWSFVADDQSLLTGDITVSLARWNQEQAQLLQHAGKVGIRLIPGDQLETLTGASNNIALVELNFPSFGDGRLFSLARLLRDQHGYQGEIRATGKFLADQVFYLHRVGVDSFELTEDKDIKTALAAINDFSVSYQPSSQ